MKAIIFDTETTGLLSHPLSRDEVKSKVTEFYGELVDLKTREVLGVMEFLCNPGVKLTDKIIEITGITDEMLKDQPPFSHFIDPLQQFFDTSSAMVAHNLYFDFNMIKGEAPELKMPVTRICTVVESEHLFTRRLKLMELHEFLFDEKFEEAHRAKNDVQALTRCACEMHKRGMI